MTNQLIFQNRRLELGRLFNRTVFLIPSGNQPARSHSVRYRYKTPSDFLYLTGLEVPSSLLLVLGRRSLLFVRDESEHDRVWGEEERITGGGGLLNFDAILKLSQFEEVLSDFAPEADRIAAPIGRDPELDKTLLSQITYGRSRTRRALALCDSRTLVGTLRLKKDEGEMNLLREACKRSSLVHRELMRLPVTGLSEVAVANWIEARFLDQGLRWPAYETIVGSGPRATLLHARATTKAIQDGELVLVDAGGEWNGYCSDITRVIPAAERLTVEQKDIYSIVLSAQKAALNSVRPGQTISSIHAVAFDSLTASLAERGLATKDSSEMRRLMPHNTSHWIGLDVHDPSPYIQDNGSEIILEAGMTFTVEPGLYFPHDHPSRYQGIGVRIEDNVLVTDKGHEVLTSAPKEITEIESLRSEASRGIGLN
jgi:Xaa-Pro aminopeptidase